MTAYEKLLLAARYSPTTIGNMILNPKGAYASADAIKLLERQIATITRQRDLAVEALEWAADVLPPSDPGGIGGCDCPVCRALEAIKESEAK